jgi:hypothetical protein
MFPCRKGGKRRVSPIDQEQQKKSYRLQLAGVWIGAASLALALAKAILDLWGMAAR